MTTLLASTKHLVRYVNQALNLLNLYHRCANEHYVLPRQELSYTHQIAANLSNTRQFNDDISRGWEYEASCIPPLLAGSAWSLAALMSMLYAAWFVSRPFYDWDMIPYLAIASFDARAPRPIVCGRRLMKLSQRSIRMKN